MANFPPEFLSFLEENKIDLSFYSTELRKFFYITDPSMGKVQILEYIPEAVESTFSHRCFSAPASFSFKRCRLYSEAKIIPIDGASVMAVLAMKLERDDNVLDLCCAPGAKLVVLSCLLQNLEGVGSVTGVDLAKGRLEICRSLVKKYRLPRIRLFLEDGRKFTSPPHILLNSSRAKPFSYPWSSIPFYSSSEYRKRPGILLESGTYDKVIVDAPCTHDGSIKHVQELVKCSWKSFDFKILGETRISELYDLQFKLLDRAFHLVKSGGLIIYSTCSLSPFQNQKIIEKFLEEHKNRIFLKSLPSFISTSESMTIIHPKDHGCGALFIALLIKM